MDYPINIHKKEEHDLLVEQKDKLLARMGEISKKLKDKENINNFLDEEDDKDLSEKVYDDALKKGKCKLFVHIKVFGGLLFISHLVSIYEINGIINAIEEELMASVKSYARHKDRESKDDFYQNFNKLNNKLPDYSVFFISSFLSEYLNECISHEILTFIISIINILVLSLGFSKFEFNLDRKDYKNYTLNEFLFLYSIYVILCLSQGVIALYPLVIIKKGFIFYDLFNEKYEETNNKKINESKSNNMILNNHNNLYNVDENNNVNKKKHKLENYFIFYLICITFSISLKILLDFIFIDEYKYSSREKVNNYFIINYIISLYFSLFLYKCYSFILLNENEKQANQISSMKLCGYVIYNESMPNYDIICKNDCNNECYNKFYICRECLEDCGICCKTFNTSLCCYICSCSGCCKTICCCQCNKCNENDKDIKKRTYNDINKIEAICICYRVTGRWNWIGNILTIDYIYPLFYILYFILITNMGFEDIIWNNLKKNNNNDFLVNFIILATIIVYYFIHIVGGKVLIELSGKLFNIKDFRRRLEACPGEYKDIFFGYIAYIITQTLCSIILSVIIYFDSKKIHYFVLSITLGSVEYIKINILEVISFFYEINYKNYEFFSSSTIFSFYLLIWNFILFILDLLGVENKTLILVQFIFGIILVAFIFIIFALLIFLLKHDKNRFDYNSDKHSIDIINN